VAQEEDKRYTYTARNAAGELVSGTLTAADETVAARRLQSLGLQPLALQQQTSARRRPEGKALFAKKVKAKHLSLFARQFATMTDAGLPLIRSLAALNEQADHPELKRVLPLVRRAVEEGKPLSVALEQHGDVFPPLMIGMIASGELSGSLSQTLSGIADNYDKEARLRGKVVSAMTYPTIVLGLAFVMVAFMMVFVIPTFKQVFTNLGGELPLPTQILMTISESSIFIFPVLIALMVAFAAWWKKHKSDPGVRNFIDPLKLRLPVMGKFVQKVIIARFARTFASLLESGVPMIQTLDIVSRTAGSVVISRALDEVRQSVRAGKQVSTVMADHPIFTPLVTQMVNTGEETGALSVMLSKVADFYEQEVDTGSDQLSATLEPILLILLAVVVGGMIVALYLPIFSIYEQLQV
jgi:type IV pilus assembly protein PilC